MAVDKFSRRDFMQRALKASVAVTGVTSLAYLRYDSDGPARSEPLKEQSLQLAHGHNFCAHPEEPSRLAIVRNFSRQHALDQALASLGGLNHFIRPGDKVLLKVNAAFASAPVLGATSHPELVSHLSRCCLQVGAAEVRVADNPINDPMSCFRLTGIGEAAEQSGARLILPRPEYFQNATLAPGQLIRDWPLFQAPLDGVNKVISLAPLKDHHRSGASMTIKNWYGLLGGRRNIFHQDIHNIIKELAMLITPTLAVLDGTQVMMTNGPTGGSLADLNPLNTLIVGTDQVAVDSFGATLLNKNATDLPHLGKAASLGLGTTDYARLTPIRINA